VNAIVLERRSANHPRIGLAEDEVAELLQISGIQVERKKSQSGRQRGSDPGFLMTLPEFEVLLEALKSTIRSGCHGRRQCGLDLKPLATVPLKVNFVWESNAIPHGVSSTYEKLRGAQRKHKEPLEIVIAP
jgi:hypothetical protein